MADKAQESNDKVSQYFQQISGALLVDTTAFTSSDDSTKLNDSIKSYSTIVDEITDTSTGNNTFTAGNKKVPIGEASTAVTGTIATLTESKKEEDKKKDEEKVRKLTDPSLAKKTDDIDKITAMNLFLYRPEQPKQTPITDPASKDSIITRDGLVTGKLGDNSNATLISTLADKGGVCVDTTQKPSFFATVANKCKSMSGVVKDKFAAVTKTGAAINSKIVASGVAGVSAKKGLLDNLKSFNLKKTISKFSNAVLTGDNIIGKVVSTGLAIKKTAQEKLKQLDTFQKQISGIVGNFRDTCNIKKNGKGADLSNLFGSDGWDTRLSNPVSENDLLDKLDFFTDAKVLSSFKKMFDKFGNAINAKDVQNLLCRTVTGNIKGADIKNYLAEKVGNNDIVSKVGYANDLMKLVIKTDDPMLITKSSDGQNNSEVITIFKNADQKNIELTTANCARRGAPRALDKIIEIYGKHKVKKYQHKIIQAHVNDDFFNQTLFDEHKIKYNIDMDKYKSGKYGEVIVKTNSTFNKTYNIGELKTVDLVQVKNDVIMTSGSSFAVVKETLTSDDMMLATMPIM